MPTITVPTADPVVVTHHERALTVIAAMSPSRAYGAETNLRGWRRTVDGIDPAREDGWAFKGASMIAGAAATLCEGTLIVTYDASWAKAKWYAGNFIAPTERLAGLYEVADGKLIRRVQSVRSGWAQDLIGWLRANRPDVVGITVACPGSDRESLQAFAGEVDQIAGKRLKKTLKKMRAVTAKFSRAR